MGFWKTTVIECDQCGREDECVDCCDTLDEIMDHHHYRPDPDGYSEYCEDCFYEMFFYCDSCGEDKRVDNQVLETCPIANDVDFDPTCNDCVEGYHWTAQQEGDWDAIRACLDAGCGFAHEDMIPLYSKPQLTL